MAKVLEDKYADVMVTDPPYNVDYGGTINGKDRNIANDNFSEDEFYQFLLSFYKAAEANLKKGAPVYVFHSTKESVNFIKAMVNAGFKYAQTLVWYKNHFTLGRQDYQWIHEPILYGWKEGAGHYFINDRTLSTVYEDVRLNARKMSKADLVGFIDKLFEQPTSVILENKPSKSADHPTIKPITLCAKLIYNSSHEGDAVLEPFGGSGSTLVAAEQLNRRCCAIELEPKYCDVIVRRYKELCPAAKERILEKLQSATVSEITDSCATAINEVNAKIEKLQEQMMELLMKRNNGEITDKEYEQQSQQVGMQIDQLLMRKEEILSEQGKVQLASYRIEEVTKLLQTGKILEEFDRVMFKSLVRKITVLSNKEIEIEFECGITVRETL